MALEIRGTKSSRRKDQAKNPGFFVGVSSTKQLGESKNIFLGRRGNKLGPKVFPPGVGKGGVIKKKKGSK